MSDTSPQPADEPYDLIEAVCRELYPLWDAYPATDDEYRQRLREFTAPIVKAVLATTTQAIEARLAELEQERDEARAEVERVKARSAWFRLIRPNADQTHRTPAPKEDT